jgi:hypothetical protein
VRPSNSLSLRRKITLNWAHNAEIVFLIGPSGVSKSQIAAAHAAQLIEQKVRVKWFSAVALGQNQHQAKRDLDLMMVMTQLDKDEVLFIDVFTPWILVGLLIKPKKRNMDRFMTGSKAIIYDFGLIIICKTS